MGFYKFFPISVNIIRNGVLYGQCQVVLKFVKLYYAFYFLVISVDILVKWCSVLFLLASHLLQLSI